MTISDLLKCFSSDTCYSIRDKENPHYIIWWGRGNKLTGICDNKIVCGIQHTSKKIIIYI